MILLAIYLVVVSGSRHLLGYDGESGSDKYALPEVRQQYKSSLRQIKLRLGKY